MTLNWALLNEIKLRVEKFGDENDKIAVLLFQNDEIDALIIILSAELKTE